MLKSISLCYSIWFTLRSLIHFEFIFVYYVTDYSNFIPFHVAVQFSQDQLLKSLSSSIVYTCLLCWKLIDLKCIGLFLAIHPVPLIYGSIFVPVPFLYFVVYSEVRMHNSHSQDCIGYQWSFSLSTNFLIICSRSVKNTTGILIGIALNLGRLGGYSQIVILKDLESF